MFTDFNEELMAALQQTDLQNVLLFPLVMHNFGTFSGALKKFIKSCHYNVSDLKKLTEDDKKKLPHCALSKKIPFIPVKLGKENTQVYDLECLLQSADSINAKNILPYEQAYQNIISACLASKTVTLEDSSSLEFSDDDNTNIKLEVLK